MLLQGLRTAIYRVEDLAAAKEWYARVLGFGPYFDEPFYVGFDVGGFELGLQPDGDGADRSDAGVVAYWGVEDADVAHGRLIELGAIERGGVQDVGEGIRIGSVVDPFGNAFGIVENPNFQIRDAQIS